MTLLSSGLGMASGARADPPAIADDKTPVEVLAPSRMELAGFPIIGGNTDIGVQFGGAATLTRFGDSVLPYLWNVDLLLSASAKSDQYGLRLIQHSDVLRLDAPDLLDGRLRLDICLSFQRTVDAGYYGIGNATTAGVPSVAVPLGHRYQYLQQETRARAIARIHTDSPVDLALGGILRYESPAAYAGSKLAEDRAVHQRDDTPVIRGLDPAALASVAAGIIYDTRDSEFITGRGSFYQVGVGGTAGSADGIRYGQASAVLSNYAHLIGAFTFASRLVASFELGNVPFYDLSQGGVFEPQNVTDGESGIRGVPQGRYAGLVKVVTNTEIRYAFPRFHLFGERLRIGTTTFFDAGRVWGDYRSDPARDGSKLGLKYGVGGGLFLQWGEAAIFRIEAAYSPDAQEQNPGFPVGVYVADGLMF